MTCNQTRVSGDKTVMVQSDRIVISNAHDGSTGHLIREEDKNDEEEEESLDDDFQGF